MYKKFMLACMAITAFAAFVIAPAASAGTLTDNGKPLAAGASIVGIGTEISRFTGGFGVECEVATLNGTVTQNNTTGPIKGTVPVGGATFTNKGGAACSSALGATTVKVTSELCLEVAVGSDVVKTTGCGGSVVFDLTAAGITCKYETASVSGTATTNVDPATVKVFEQPANEVGGSFYCPDTGKLDMDFDLYTTDLTTPVTFT